jgi:hypothetical protein
MGMACEEKFLWNRDRGGAFVKGDQDERAE